MNTFTTKFIIEQGLVRGGFWPYVAPRTESSMSKHVIALVDDLFWKARLLETAKATGATMALVSDPAQLTVKCAEHKPDIVFVDLALRKDPFGAIRAFKDTAETAGVPVVGYFEHMRTDLHKRGKEAGIETLIARSTFTEKLASFLL
jgi:PleD family two-component response regulator